MSSNTVMTIEEAADTITETADKVVPNIKRKEEVVNTMTTQIQHHRVHIKTEVTGDKARETHQAAT